jgi:magnesium-transporting ATPase (P-type)
MIFTALPLAGKAIFDQDVNYLRLVRDQQGSLVIKQVDSIRNLIPYIYKVGQTDSIFNNVNFLFWIAKGILHGFIIWLTCLYGCQDGSIVNDGGHTIDFWFISVVMFSCVYLVATLQKIYMIRYWTIFNVLSITVFSIAAYIAWLFISDLLLGLAVSGVQDRVWKSGVFYLLLLLNAGWFTCYDYCERFLREWLSFNITSRAMKLVKSGQAEVMTIEEMQHYLDPERERVNKVRQKEKDPSTRTN